MRIKSNRVKCGDCNIIISDREQLLIDCGSSNADGILNSSEFAFNAINNEIQSGSITDIMISHFDKDHYNGVLLIPDSYKVRTVYLPYSIIDGHIPYVNGISRLLAVASPKSWGFKLSNSLIDLFSKIEQISSTIRFLQRGDKIPFDGMDIRVLWPEVVTTGFNYKGLSVKRVLTETDDHSLYRIFDEMGEIYSYEDAERGLAHRLVEIVGSEDNSLIVAMNGFIVTLGSYLRKIHGDGNTDATTSYTEVKEALEALSEQRELFRKNA